MVTSVLRSYLKQHPFIYSLLREIRIKWLNYFAEYGEVPRFVNQLLAPYFHQNILQSAIRKKIAKQCKIQANAQMVELVNEIEKNGFAIRTFEEIEVNQSEALIYIEQIINDFKVNEGNENYYEQLDSGKYAGKALSYHLYNKPADILASDAFMKLVMEPYFTRLASIYLGNLPILDFTSVVFTPVHGSQQFGAQLWHKDLHHRRSLKIFFSPYDLTLDNGPFEFFPAQVSTLAHYKYSPQSMTDEQLLETGLNPQDAHRFFGGKNKVLFVDTARCLHRGGRTKIPRYMATATYCSVHHSFPRQDFLASGHYKIAFLQHANENTELLKHYMRLL